MQDDNLIERIYATVEEVVEDSFEEYKKAGRNEKANVAKEMQEVFKNKYAYTLQEEVFNNIEKNGWEKEAQSLLSYFKEEINKKEEEAGKENLNFFIRWQYLQAIDKKWLNHLENLEALREAVYLRSYGQKNPLIEYKLEGSDIFNRMINDIRFDMASIIMRVKVNTEEGDRAERSRVISGRAMHASTSTFRNSNMQGRNNPDNVQIVRSVPKVGRNDLCPCGSGKKYKHCCGKQALSQG